MMSSLHFSIYFLKIGLGLGTIQTPFRIKSCGWLSDAAVEHQAGAGQVTLDGCYPAYTLSRGILSRTLGWCRPDDSGWMLSSLRTEQHQDQKGPQPTDAASGRWYRQQHLSCILKTPTLRGWRNSSVVTWCCPEDPSSIPRTHVRWLQSTCNSNSWGSDAPLWCLLPCIHKAYTSPNTHTHKSKNKS